MNDTQTQCYPQQAVPELDGRLWQVWKEKNHVKDRARAARRRRVGLLLVSVAVCGFAGARIFGFA